MSCSKSNPPRHFNLIPMLSPGVRIASAATNSPPLAASSRSLSDRAPSPNPSTISAPFSSSKMKIILDETHDPNAQSWVESANAPNSDFPLQNLPFGVFRRRDAATHPTVGVAIGDHVLDLAALQTEKLFSDEITQQAAEACASSSLNALMSLGTAPRQALRRRLHSILRDNAAPPDRDAASRHLIPQSDVEMLLPAAVGDYSDFYASIF